MSWVTVESINTGGYGYTRLQYDDSSTGESRSSRVIFELNSGASIYVYFNNFTVDGNNLGQKLVTGSCTLWEGSLSAGNRTVSYTCPWYSGSVNYSGTGYIPSGIAKPSGLSVTLKSKTYNSATFATSVSSYGTPASANGRYIEAAILGQNSYGTSYRFATASNTTSSTITVNNSSNANPSSFSIEGNHKYWYGCFASNTQASDKKVAGTFYTPCPPLSTLTFTSQSYSTYNKVNAVISYKRQADGGAETRTGYYRYSTDGGSTYSAWTSFGTVSVAAGTAATFTANLPTSSSIRLQAKLSTPNGGDSTIKTVTFSTLNTHTAPNFSNFEYVDNNPDTVALTGNNQTMIQGQSVPLITISQANKATGNDGVNVTNYSAVLTGRSNTASYSSDSNVNIQLGTPTEAGTSSLTVSAIDSLSTSKAVSKQVVIYPWSAPTISSSAQRVNNFEPDTRIRASGVYSPITIDGVVKNTLTFQYRVKQSSSSSWGAWVSKAVSISGSNWTVPEFSVTLDNNYQWDVETKIADEFTGTTVALSVSVGIATFRIGTDGYVYNNEKRMLTVDDLTGSALTTQLLNKIYPVGSIYISYVNKNPSTFLGGTWSAFASGRTLVGINTSDTDFATVGKTGGSKTVTLTVDQMPSHTHTIAGFPNGNPATWADPNVRVVYQTTSNNPYPTVSALINKTGGGQAHGNLQPYITVYIWRRTA
ncbi:hypothetical protein IKD67_01815 [Candidatus Saccharibacteria bacterium]|nr:hypothetical protein [Candidatus Saccharibacteria bacterium]